MSRIICIGDAMVDVIVELGEEINIGSDTRSTISMVGGGAAANTACWLGSTGNDVVFVGRVGSDAAGQQFIAELDRCHVRHGEMIVDDATTGIVVVLVDKKGERTMFPDSGANGLLSAKDVPPLDGISGVFLSGYSLYNSKTSTVVSEIVGSVKEGTVPLIFDPASVGPMRNFGRERVLDFIRNVDCLILNRDEARFLSDLDDVRQSAEFLHSLTPTVVIKLGSEGAIGISRDGGIIESPSTAREVIDSTGAGDAFAAGFLPIWLTKNDLSEALINGNRLAGECVAILGARPRVNPR
jgi:sugar/nucleoside kinase (ribokinase family)